MKAFLPISKVEERDDGTLFVVGVASTEALDVQGEIVTAEAMKSAMPEFFKYGSGNLREMHQPMAAGTVEKAYIEDGKTMIECIVVDPIAIKKVQTGVYKGFSIGGKALAKFEKTITSLRLSEISLVDRPANPEATITMWKADGAEDAEVKAVDVLADMLNKGEITPERLVELAKAEKPVAKSYYGEEIFDAQVALRMLGDLIYLLAKEQAEGESVPEQVAALQAAFAGLKAFVVSELTEETTIKFEDADGIAKAGKMISAANMEKLQALHDSLTSLGVACGTEKHDHAADIAKADGEKSEALAKLADAEGAIAKLSAEADTLKGEIERLKAMPAPGKALLNAVAVSKSEDGGGDSDAISKFSPITDAQGDTNDVASIIKMIHSKGGVIVNR
jgi:hypothetical protein